MPRLKLYIHRFYLLLMHFKCAFSKPISNVHFQNHVINVIENVHFLSCCSWRYNLLFDGNVFLNPCLVCYMCAWFWMRKHSLKIKQTGSMKWVSQCWLLCIIATQVLVELIGKKERFSLCAVAGIRSTQFDVRCPKLATRISSPTQETENVLATAPIYRFPLKTPLN